MDGLVNETKQTDARLHNTFNEFLMLSNKQFIENRVYEDETDTAKTDADTAPEAPSEEVKEKTREQKEMEIVPKFQAALKAGMDVLTNAFVLVDEDGSHPPSGSESEGEERRPEPVLEPKDVYVCQPGPCPCVRACDARVCVLVRACVRMRAPTGRANWAPALSVLWARTPL